MTHNITHLKPSFPSPQKDDLRSIHLNIDYAQIIEEQIVRFKQILKEFKNDVIDSMQDFSKTASNVGEITQLMKNHMNLLISERKYAELCIYCVEIHKNSLANADVYNKPDMTEKCQKLNELLTLFRCSSDHNIFK